ncbi:MAG TPA: DUF4199 domain-containing protein [Bacteroidales bacterium]|nr:DUF4199 domain-containing protein [Bacteroidales bacterium]
MEENGKVPVFKASLIYGAIVGIISGLIALILYFINQSLETWSMIASPLIFVILIVGALIMFRKEYGNGYAKFKQLVLVSFLVGIIAGIISSTFTIVLFEIDESYLQDTKYFAIERMDQQMEKMDARYQERFSPDQYDRIADQMDAQREKQTEKIMGRSSVSFAYTGIINLAFMALITGLIAGLFIKKNPPEPGM